MQPSSELPRCHSPKDKDYGPTVLVVDDTTVDRIATVQLVTEAAGRDTKTLRVLECGSIAKAIEILSREEVYVMLLDKDLSNADPGHHFGVGTINSSQDGIQAIPRFLAIQPHLKILVHTASDDVQDAERAMQNGA